MSDAENAAGVVGTLTVSVDSANDAVEGTSEIVTLIAGRNLRVGRSTTNDYTVNNRNVSRFHALFSASTSGVVLSDLSSLNGTFVNEQRISSPVDLNSGDVVKIGDTEFHVSVSLGGVEDIEGTNGRTQAAELASVIVTILVADICGYTKMSEALPAQDVANSVNAWLEQTSSIVRANQGEVDKYIGDCVMAVWKRKAEKASDSAGKAFLAAREIINNTEVWASANWKYHAEHPFNCRVALHTGEALVGAVGGAGKREFTVMGDTVNVAFRLESLAGKQNETLVISESTAELLGNKGECKDLGVFQVKGRLDGVHVYSASCSGADQ